MIFHYPLKTTIVQKLDSLQNSRSHIFFIHFKIMHTTITLCYDNNFKCCTINKNQRFKGVTFLFTAVVPVLLFLGAQLVFQLHLPKQPLSPHHRKVKLSCLAKKTFCYESKPRLLTRQYRERYFLQHPIQIPTQKTLDIDANALEP